MYIKYPEHCLVLSKCCVRGSCLGVLALCPLHLWAFSFTLPKPSCDAYPHSTEKDMRLQEFSTCPRKHRLWVDELVLVTSTEGNILFAYGRWRVARTHHTVKASISVVLSFGFYMPAPTFQLKVEKCSRNLIGTVLVLRLKKKNESGSVWRVTEFAPGIYLFESPLHTTEKYAVMIGI